MPIYEYRCGDCQHQFEYLVLGQQEPEACPKCKGGHISKMMSTCGFFSKGGGGETIRSSAGASSCTGCTATSCSSCGH